MGANQQLGWWERPLSKLVIVGFALLMISGKFGGPLGWVKMAAGQRATYVQDLGPNDDPSPGGILIRKIQLDGGWRGLGCDNSQTPLTSSPKLPTATTPALK